MYKIIMDLIINRFYGNNNVLNGFHQKYLNSLSELKDCHKFLIYHSINDSNLEKLSRYYDTVIEMQPVESNLFILKSIEAMIRVLNEYNGKYKNVLYTDSLDIIFQKNPFEFLRNFEETLFLCTPGYTVSESMADVGWLNYFNKTLMCEKNLFDEQVINGGIYGGTIDHLISFLSFVCSNINKNSEHIVDQTAMNYFVKLNKNSKKIKIFNTHLDTWAYHTQIYKDKPNIIDGKIYNKNMELYCIWHMWDDFIHGSNNQEKIEIGFK